MDKPTRRGGRGRYRNATRDTAGDQVLLPSQCRDRDLLPRPYCSHSHLGGSGWIQRDHGGGCGGRGDAVLEGGLNEGALPFEHGLLRAPQLLLDALEILGLAQHGRLRRLVLVACLVVVGR